MSDPVLDASLNPRAEFCRTLALSAGEIARRGTDCDCISVAEGFLRGLQRFDLDGEAVAVPAGDIRDFIALGDMKTANDIFGDFIQGVANV